MTATLAVETATVLNGRLITWTAIKEFLWAGNATFTLVSLKTGMRYTYKVKVKKEDRAASLEDQVYFISLLRGPDNSADYKYIGLLRKPGCFFITQASKLNRTSPAVVALVWFLDKMTAERDVLGGRVTSGDDNGEALVEFWHTGHCGRCGRLLTVPSSVASGIGPVCDGREG